MRRIVQFFHDGDGPNDRDALCALADDGTVWRRRMSGFGDHGWDPPSRVWWEPADPQRFPPIPQETQP